jgi:hypothetical protein
MLAFSLFCLPAAVSQTSNEAAKEPPKKEQAEIQTSDRCLAVTADLLLPLAKIPSALTGALASWPIPREILIGRLVRREDIDHRNQKR